MLTKNGLLAALEALVEKKIVCGLYTNEVDGDDVRMADLIQAKNYEPVAVAGWKVDREALTATGGKVSFPFKGRAGKIVGSCLSIGDVLVSYSPMMDPVPISSNEDVIRVVPRFTVRRSS